MACFEIAKETYNIVVVGKTGTGKSSTCNTILNRNVFKAKQDSSSITNRCQLESAEVGNIILNVIDTPGLMDTRKSKEEILRKLGEVVSLCPDGFHAFLFVLQITQRYTDAEIETLNTIKSLFGTTFINICIIVFTYGDAFDMSNEAIPFNDWLDQQQGKMAQLIDDCEKRCLLFYNATKYPLYEQKRQENLIKLLHLIRDSEMMYIDTHFMEIEKRIEKMVIEEKLPQYEAKYQKKLSLISATVETATETCEDSKINKLQNEVNELIKLIETDDKDTGVLEGFLNEAYELNEMVKDLRKKKSEKLAKKIAEKARHMKNKPNSFLHFLATAFVTFGGILATAATVVVLPVAVAIGTTTVLATGVSASVMISKENKHIKELNTLNNEIKQLEM